MADDRRVIRQADVARVVLVVFAARRGGLVAHDEGALHVDAHVARVQDGLVYVRLGRGASRTRRQAIIQRICSRRSSLSPGIARRRGVRVSAARGRHGCASAGAWLQPRPFCPTAMKVAQTTSNPLRLRGEVGCGQERGVGRRRR